MVILSPNIFERITIDARDDLTPLLCRTGTRSSSTRGKDAELHPTPNVCRRMGTPPYTTHSSVHLFMVGMECALNMCGQLLYSSYKVCAHAWCVFPVGMCDSSSTLNHAAPSTYPLFPALFMTSYCASKDFISTSGPSRAKKYFTNCRVLKRLCALPCIEMNTKVQR